jgi:hypothetical protein
MNGRLKAGTLNFVGAYIKLAGNLTGLCLRMGGWVDRDARVGIIDPVLAGLNKERIIPGGHCFYCFLQCWRFPLNIL